MHHETSWLSAPSNIKKQQTSSAKLCTINMPSMSPSCFSNTAVTCIAKQPKERFKCASFLFGKRVDVTCAAKQLKRS
ncbi:hypothetical protein NDU88_002750 [Pleurodeles waltl]|uniref:Uncharacterized protein n=1 Tax=Pleurodeles waltl TaxID=8319 RepID=A0AAV7UAM3_PLEWA|nr:hypothetical protein NDU88_002750 [Pleurodeles waltl]